MQRARTFKVYLTNPSVRAALFGFVRSEDEAMGNLAETASGASGCTIRSSVDRSTMHAGSQAVRPLEVDIVSIDVRTQAPLCR